MGEGWPFLALIAALPGESICPAQRALQGRRTAFPRIAPRAPWVARATSGCVPNQLFLAPTWTGEGEGSGLFDAAPRLRFAPCPRPLPFPASGPTGARPLAPFTYGICTRTEQGKKNTGQEQEQKTKNTGVRVLPVAQCAAADGRRQTGDARWANTSDQPWATDTSYRVC